uniref:Methyltransferase domain-containing protein n=1 Tax=Candidatus Kentrum sp. TC TaxID=2126339 RepID=A0A450YEM9_9GAMM|nr:MAG: hypothetical protein BECKTC1821E_GA0114239_100622 [Candidatus Kentron sp. TC]
MYIHELLREKAKLPPREELRKRMRELSLSEEFWREIEEVYKVFAYYWNAHDKGKILEEIAFRVIDSMTDTENTLPEILDIGAGKGDKILGIMEMVLTEARRLVALDIVEPSAEVREEARKLLPRYRYGAGAVRRKYPLFPEKTEKKWRADHPVSR